MAIAMMLDCWCGALRFSKSYDMIQYHSLFLCKGKEVKI